MLSLHDLQRSFRGALTDASATEVVRYVVDDGFDASERIGIHRNGSRGSLVAALRLAFPAVEKIVGREFFDEAAARFVVASPPASGCLSDYGAALADFLASFAPARELRYLADVARFEWALGCAANADDAPFLDPHALQSVDPVFQPRVSFVAHPSLRLLRIDHPADRIADAVLAGDGDAMRAVDTSSGPVRLVVHRGPAGVAAERVDAEEHDFLAALCAGEMWSRLAERWPRRSSPLLAEQLVKGRLTHIRVPGPEREAP